MRNGCGSWAWQIHNILFVVTTTRGDETCRIISARRATRYEQDRYYTSDREAW
jgi:uncharacterized DUF497 family protein